MTEFTSVKYLTLYQKWLSEPQNGRGAWDQSTQGTRRRSAHAGACRVRSIEGGGPRLAQLVDRLVGLGHTPIDLSPRVMNSYIYGCRWLLRPMLFRFKVFLVISAFIWIIFLAYGVTTCVLTANSRFHGHTKHIEVSFHFVWERVARHQLGRSFYFISRSDC
jgi:hypothetical protein